MNIVSFSVILGFLLGVPLARSACSGADGSEEVLDLKVIPVVDGVDALVSWEYPMDICYQSFVIGITPLDTYGKIDGDVKYYETELQSTSIPELEPGRPYRFNVKVKYDENSYGAEASKIATPFGTCKENGTPGKVPVLVVQEQENGFNLDGDTATICWTSPTSGACIDEYTLGRRMQARNDAEAFNEVRSVFFLV
jgi:hypothetical protein